MTDNNISIFTYQTKNVRTVLINDQPYFCLSDVRKALDIKGSLKVGNLDTNGVKKIRAVSKGGRQETNFINEPNLYRLIFRSNKTQAKHFANWVYEEVLPTIRKTGSYLKDTSEIESIIHTCIRKALADFFTTKDDEPPTTGRSFLDWEILAVHSLGAMKSEYYGLKNKVEKAQDILG